jgi:hypothetical protein
MGFGSDDVGGRGRLQQGPDPLVLDARHLGEHGHPRRAQDAGCFQQLCGLLGKPGQPVLEDLAYADRDRASRGAPAGLQPRDLGDEERVAPGAAVQLVGVRRRRLLTRDSPDQGRGLVRVESRQGEAAYVAAGRQVAAVLAGGGKHADALTRQGPGKELEQPQGAGVRPVQVLEDDEQGITASA